MVDLIIKSKVKEAAKGLRVSGDVPDALSKAAEKILEKAAERAKANKRGTIMVQDL